MRRLVLFLIGTVLSFSQVLNAQQISESEAKDKALSFFNSRPATTNKSALRAPARGSTHADVQLAYKATDGTNNFFYVYNNGENNGFVIVGGDEKVESILAYSYSGHIDMDNASENFKWWVSTTEKGISRSLRMNQSYLSSGDGSHVEPLLTTHWGQGYPYNAMTPTFSVDDSLVNCPTGCVATSMAQVINYHKYPEVGLGSHSYVLYNTGSRIDLFFDYSNTVFDWTNMRDSYNEPYNENEANAVSTLMYACGVAVDMNYGFDESGADRSLIAPALRDYFGYIAINESPELSTIKTELNQGNPLIYSGDTHSMVIDGYDENGLLHLNMGWDGSSDGYYAMNDMGGYSYDGEIVIIQIPNEENQYYYNVEVDSLIYNLNGKYKTAELIGSIGEIKKLEVPEFVIYKERCYPVKKIGYNAFTEQTALEEILLPEGLEIIGEEAFWADTLLTDFVIPNSVVEIGQWAFSGCASLKSINIPQNVRQLAQAFRGCDNLVSFSINNNNPYFYYSEGGIYSKTDNTLVDAIQNSGTFIIKEGTENIGAYACYGTKSEEIIIPNTVRRIGHFAFQQNWELKRLVLPESIEELGIWPFSGLTNLEYLYIPSKANVDCHEFVECLKLKTIEISENNPYLRVMDNMVFSKDTTVLYLCSVETPDSIFLPSNTQFIGQYAFMHRKMKYVDLSNIKAFGDGIFSHCENLESIVIPEGIQRIPGETCIRCHSLKEITLPSTLEEIWYSAFGECYNLVSINCNFSNPFSISDDYYDSYFMVNGMLTVPVGTRASFENTKGWKDFTIFEKDELPEVSDVDSIMIIPSRSFIFMEDDSITVTAILLPDNIATTDVVWATCGSIKEKYVTIDNNGVIRPSVSQDLWNFADITCDLYAIAKDHSKTFAKITIPMVSPYNTFKVRVYIDNEVFYEGSSYYGQSIDEIKQIVFSIDTIKEGMTFSGWSFPDVEDTGSQDFWGTTYYDVHGSFTINKYLLTYKVDGKIVSTDSIAYGTALTAKKSPTQKGYTFSGWSEIPATMPANDVTVTGSFTINSYVITYMVDGEVFYQDTIEYNGSISLPTAPKKEGYIFVDWLDLPETMPSHDVTITANFTVDDGVIGIELDDSYRVYDITGKFLGEMTDEDLKLLKPGVYIVNNKKLRVK